MTGEQSATLRLGEVLDQALPSAPQAHAWFEGEAREAQQATSHIRRLLQVLEDVRRHVEDHRALRPGDKGRLFEAFGSVRGGVALTCAAHASIAEEAEAREGSRLRPAAWHVEQILIALDSEAARLQALLPEAERWEADRRESKAAQALLPSEATLGKVMRYESHLDRELHRALSQLERLQRQRLGDVVLPPVQLDVTLT